MNDQHELRPLTQLWDRGIRQVMHRSTVLGRFAAVREPHMFTRRLKWQNVALRSIGGVVSW